jgi:hypothetical protein
MTLVIVLIAAYFAVLVALSAAAMPYRWRMRKLGAELCALDLTERERDLVDHLLIYAYSWRTSIILSLVFLVGLFQGSDSLRKEADQRAQQMPTLARDPRLHELMDGFFASAIGVNPVFGIFAILLKYAFVLKVCLRAPSDRAARMADLRAAAAV